jgi:general secretion pathway protein A
MNSYRPFFGFTKEPFSPDLSLSDIMKTPELLAVSSRFQYALSVGGIGVVTGEIGSGKSTAVRYAQGELHPSDSSKALMTSMIRTEIKNLVSAKKLKPVLIIDEASLLRLDVFAELHTLLQFEQDAKAYLPLILVGQASLIDKLSFRNSAALASRVITRCHLDGLNLQDMRLYLDHHTQIAGISINLFDDPATVAIHQGSGGLLRKANHLARGLSSPLPKTAPRWLPPITSVWLPPKSSDPNMLIRFILSEPRFHGL